MWVDAVKAARGVIAASSYANSTTTAYGVWTLVDLNIIKQKDVWLQRAVQPCRSPSGPVTLA
jgi:hypothetical protein